jgi:serine/threonine-protein kinase
MPVAVGRYVVRRELARGGMGAILVAEDPLLGRDVAIKVLLESHLDKRGYRERFLEEARVTGLLQHPGIIGVYEAGELSDTRPYFAMQLIEGETLDARLAAREHPTDGLPHLLHVFERVCETLAFAHSRCVIHRDLKPLNVMLAPFGVVKVMDWGVAKLHIPGVEEWGAGPADLPAPSTGAETGGVIGTPAYMAPEQAQGDHSRIDERTDVFGLGGILCAILTGQPPYTGTRTRKVYARAARADLADAFARLDASPAARELVALAKWCLAPHPDTRPRDARAVAAALTGYIESDLRRAERDLVRFFELSPDLFCIAGLDGYFHRVNGNFTRVLGYPPNELISRPFIEFVHPDDRASTSAEAEKLARGLPVVQFRNRYRDTRGNYRWFEWEAKSIPEEGIIFAVARDITDRVELESRLKDRVGGG